MLIHTNAMLLARSTWRVARSARLVAQAPILALSTCATKGEVKAMSGW